jgi:hypothetical protein
MIAKPKNPFAKQQELTSIVHLMGGAETQGMLDNDIFLAEMQLYSELKNQKILEKEDRQKIEILKKSVIKGFLISNILAGFLNRLLTKIKTSKYDFMNAYFLLRLLARLSIFALFNLNLFLVQSINIEDLRYDLNKKYIPRYTEYMRTGGHPMAILNQKYFEDPDVTQEEKDMCVKFQKMSQGPMMPGGPRI